MKIIKKSYCENCQKKKRTCNIDVREVPYNRTEIQTETEYNKI